MNQIESLKEKLRKSNKLVKEYREKETAKTQELVDTNKIPGVQDLKNKYGIVLQNNQDLKEDYLTLYDNATEAVRDLVIQNRENELKVKEMHQLLDKIIGNK